MGKRVKMRMTYLLRFCTDSMAAMILSGIPEESVVFSLISCIEELVFRDMGSTYSALAYNTKVNV
jgi:hypothetical protein